MISNETWDKLRNLRSIFLEGTSEEVYWESEEDLMLYEQFFAQRIGWKCSYVFKQLAELGWVPPKTELLDWGCGSGIATRTFLDAFGPESVTSLTLWDHSPHAIQVATTLTQPKLNSRSIYKKNTFHQEAGVLLLSHVITELTDWQISEILKLARKAEALIWIEPGTYEASHGLIDIRQELLGEFHVVAPCTHQKGCPMIQPEHEHHWCHFFGDVPPEAFTRSDWAHFAKLMGIDLRALPLSYLVLDKRPVKNMDTQIRMIGRARMQKPYVELLGCSSEGMQECQLPKRHFPVAYKQFKKGKVGSLQKWECNGNQISVFEDIH
jgi:hypothetical protein